MDAAKADLEQSKRFTKNLAVKAMESQKQLYLK
jgi:hypothetical protein